jgi:biotin carboxylase
MTVLILGAGVMQEPAIRIAKDFGWTVAVADGNPHASAVPLADRFINVDLKDREGLAAAARALRSECGLDGVFTAGTDFSASVAYIAAELGLPGIPFDTAIRASDKLAMRAALDAASVPSPRFAAVLSVNDALPAAERLGFPLVVKPADNMGARGCRLVRSRDELVDAVAAALPFSRSGRVVVEEYIEGPEFSIDAVITPDGVRIRGIADRHISFDPYFVELGHTMPSSAPVQIQREVRAVFEAGIRALGLTTGAAKGDIKYSPQRGGAVVGEIAARLSGGYMSGWTYPYASGIDPTAEALELCVGRVPGPAGDDRGWTSAERALVSIPGRVRSIVGLLEAERIPYVKKIFLRVVPGDETVFPTNNVQKCGNVISQAPDRGSAVGAAEAAVASLIVRLEPDTAATEAFLRGEGTLRAGRDGTWPPDAFRPGVAAQALAAMHEYGGDIPSREVVTIAPFDEASSIEGRDWSGRTFLESADLALRLGGARIASSGEAVLAGRFWRALVRGGAQAGLYVIDTARKFVQSDQRGQGVR